MNIVLYAPEIPQNTGSIARTCAATGARLHLIEPLGFEISDRYLKRAGLDYWHMMQFQLYPDWDAFLGANQGANLWFLSTKAKRDHCQVRYLENDYLVFGRETKGLPEALLAQHYERCLRIPMRPDARSLNLSNAVAIVLYEALRQQGFPALSGQGALTAASPRGE